MPWWAAAGAGSWGGGGPGFEFPSFPLPVVASTPARGSYATVNVRELNGGSGRREGAPQMHAYPRTPAVCLCGGVGGEGICCSAGPEPPAFSQVHGTFARPLPGAKSPSAPLAHTRLSPPPRGLCCLMCWTSQKRGGGGNQTILRMIAFPVLLASLEVNKGWALKSPNQTNEKALIG